jgi:hypothetical protein
MKRSEQRWYYNTTKVVRYHSATARKTICRSGKNSESKDVGLGKAPVRQLAPHDWGHAQPTNPMQVMEAVQIGSLKNIKPEDS